MTDYSQVTMCISYIAKFTPESESGQLCSEARALNREISQGCVAGFSSVKQRIRRTIHQEISLKVCVDVSTRLVWYF